MVRVDTPGRRRGTSGGGTVVLKCAVLLLLVVVATSVMMWSSLERNVDSAGSASHGQLHHFESAQSTVHIHDDGASGAGHRGGKAEVPKRHVPGDDGQKDHNEADEENVSKPPQKLTLDTVHADSVERKRRQPDVRPPEDAPIHEAGSVELLVDETCAKLEHSAAMSMTELRFSLQRFDSNIFHFEVFTEHDAMGPRGSRKRTIERSQYVPDDSVVLDMENADRMISYRGREATFTSGPSRAPDAESDLTCAGAGVFEFSMSHEPSKQLKTTVTYEHVGKRSDIDPAAAGASPRAKLARAGRELNPSYGAAKLTWSFGTEPVDFYGLGNRGSGVELPQRRIRVKNLDINHYQLDPTITLYGAVPLVYAVARRTQMTVGILVLNGSPMQVTTTQKDLIDFNVMFETTDGGLRYFLFKGPTPADVLRQYFEVTGRPFMPPRFAVGFHQSRWSYRNERDVKEVSHRFDAAGLPNDVIWLDIDHTNDKRYFTWDPHNFPHPKKMLDELAQSGRRMVTITDPHIKRDDNYHVYSEAHKHGYFVADETGTREFVGHCWPGASSWIDFVNPMARRWYSGLFDYEKYQGSSDRLYSWIDMNEPSVFSGPDVTMPMDVRHVNNIPHGQVHNLYGFYHSMAAANGHLHRSKRQQRPFVLTRSFFAGSHRYAAVWTGDNQGQWSHLQVSVEMVLLLGLSGITMAGADVGGFFDNPSPELLVRWFQLGSLYPFFRQHSDDHSTRREPFVHTGVLRQRVAQALIHRYQLLPYMYVAFAQAAGVLGDSAVNAVARHLMLMFPEDELVYKVTDTFMVGDALLARPITEQHGGPDSRARYSIFVPRRSPTTYALDRRTGLTATTPLSWFSFCTGQLIRRDGDHDAPAVADEHGRLSVMEELECPVPLFQRAGTIVPFKTAVGKSTDDLDKYPIELRIAVDVGDYAHGVMYFDDGVTNEFTHSDKRCAVRVVFESGKLCATATKSDCPDFAAEDTVQSIRLSNDTLPSWKRAVVKGTHTGESSVVVDTSSTESFVAVKGLELPVARTPHGKTPAGEAEGTLWCVYMS